MKKLIALFLACAVIMGFSACGNSSTSTEPTKASDVVEATEPAATEPVVVEKVRDLPEGDYTELGNGTVYLATAGGTSENGNVPVIYAEEDLIIKQIGLNSSDFNGGALSYIYLDGMLLDKTQLANSQITLDLSGDALAVGIHTVEVVQYENDDTAADMTTYKAMQYEIKAA